MNETTKNLISAIIFTVLALVMGFIFLFSNASLFGKGCALVLVVMCLVGQWGRYLKSKK